MSEQTHLVLQRYGVSGADGFTLPGAEASYAPDLAVEPTHLDIALRFDIAAARAAGEVRTTVRGNRSGARKLKLDAVSLEGVAVESEAALDWRYDGEAIHLTWGEPFAAGEERVFAVRYAVQDPVSGMRFSHPDAKV